MRYFVNILNKKILIENNSKYFCNKKLNHNNHLSKWIVHFHNLVLSRMTNKKNHLIRNKTKPRVLLKTKYQAKKRNLNNKMFQKRMHSKHSKFLSNSKIKSRLKTLKRTKRVFPIHNNSNSCNSRLTRVRSKMTIINRKKN